MEIISDEVSFKEPSNPNSFRIIDETPRSGGVVIYNPREIKWESPQQSKNKKNILLTKIKKSLLFTKRQGKQFGARKLQKKIEFQFYLKNIKKKR